MTVYSFDTIVGQTVTFDAANDIFSISGTEATELSVAQSGGNVTITKGSQTVTLAGVTMAQFKSGANFIVGGSNGTAIFGDDQVSSSSDNSGNTLTLPATGPVLAFGLGGGDVINASAITEDVKIFGGSGASDSTDGGDTLSIGTGNATVSGNAGNDTISFITNGTNLADIFGGAGNDSIVSGGTAGSGESLIYGNLGSDTISLAAGAGNSGDATIYGGNGIGDTADGGDNITSGTGTTYISAGGGNDTISLNITAASATVAAGVGNDNITDGATLTGEAIFSLGTGQDTIVLDALGATGDVTVYGAFESGDSTDGADSITLSSAGATTANALVAGQGGNDTISTDDGTGALTATVWGGAGNDVVDTDDGTNDWIDGGAGNDDLDTGTGNNTVFGQAGTDTITGGAGNDSIDGGADNDTITGGGGTDALAGGAGDDSVTGGAGTDSIDGGDGADTLIGAAAADTILGGDGADSIVGGDGIDALTGGAGADLFSFSTIALAINANNITDFDAGTGGDVVQIDSGLDSQAGSITAGAALTLVTVAVATGADTANQLIVDTTANITALGNLSAHAVNDYNYAIDSTTGAIWYDADGNWTAGRVQIGDLDFSDADALVAGNFAVI